MSPDQDIILQRSERKKQAEFNILKPALAAFAPASTGLYLLQAGVSTDGGGVGEGVHRPGCRELPGLCLGVTVGT